MFWKNAKITTRLTIFYSFATLLLLSVISIFLYWNMINLLHKSAGELLLDELNILQNILIHKPNDMNALKQEVLEIPLELRGSIYNYYIRILDENINKPILTTPGMSNALKGESFFEEIPKPYSKETREWTSPEGNHYLLMKSTVFSKMPHHSKIEIEAGLDVSYQHKIIQMYGKKILLSLIIGSGVAILFGYLIGQRAMRRLNDLKETTKVITATSLDQRIEPDRWPKELSDLGISFNQMLERIEASFKRIHQFSGDLAHELRTPINNLMGETEIALSKACNVEEHQHVLESNLEELHKISQIIENLLFLARTENPRLDLKKEMLNVDEEIAFICEYYQAIAEDKNIQIECEGCATLFANQNMFRRMISNILSNALKYTQNHGKIKIVIHEISREVVEISVIDNGIGMAPEHVSKIFNRFYRIDSNAATGCGLGLSIVKSIVDLHQGTISVESELNMGTKFSIVFGK